jgi:uncharacterized SAM-binding protein YcdF (DUF218 family)
MGRRSSRRQEGKGGPRVRPAGTPESDWSHLSDAPIEPDSGAENGKPVLRWTLFISLVFVMALTTFHQPLLTAAGRYLAVSHEMEKSDLIVCLAGRPVERALAAADLYRDGLAPEIFIAPEPPPDGYEVLARRSIEAPASLDIQRRILSAMDVPEHDVIVAGSPAYDTEAEAVMVGELAGERGYGSIILVTSPTHARRALMTFRRVLDGDDVAVRMHPSPYSGFRAEDWWKEGSYRAGVIVEYQKLIYYALKYYL